MVILGWLLRIVGWILTFVGVIVVIITIFMDDVEWTILSYAILDFKFTWWEATICAAIGGGISELGESLTVDI